MAENPSVFVIQSLLFDPHVIANNTRKLLPGVTVIEVTVDYGYGDKIGKVSEEDKELIRENAEVLFASPFYIPDLIFSSKRLKWIQSISAGVDTILKRMDQTKPIPDIRLTRTGGSSGNAMADYVIGQIIAWEKHFYSIHDNQRKKVWNKSLFRITRLLSSLRIGILGAGQIGTEIGSRCKANGMEVWTLSREAREKIPFDNHMITEQLPYLLENCDYICSILPSTPETRGLLSGDVLQNCQSKKSIFINIGRGDIIDEESIVKAIRNKWIGGAILDVFEKEPLPKDSELWDLSNVVITPYLSVANTHEPYVEHFVNNYMNYINGKPLVDEIDWNRGY